MWRSQLTLKQLARWSSHAPHEVPLLGGEFAWIAMRTPDWAEAVDDHASGRVMPSLTLPDADIRGYYHQLGIPLPDRPGPELERPLLRRSRRAPTRGPRPLLLGQHRQRRLAMPRLRRPRRRLRRRARARPHARSAIDLMISHGLIDRRAQLTHRPRTREKQPARCARDTQLRAVRPVLDITEQDINRWQTALSRRPSLLTRLADERGWRYPAMRELGLGLDRGRVTIPIRNRAGLLRGVLRYQPDHARRPKMLAAAGSRLGLVPHPASEPSPRLMLVEGPPDMIAARSRGLPAIAVPGDHAWQRRWSRLLAGKRVTVIMDADPAGPDSGHANRARPHGTRGTPRSSTWHQAETMDTTSPTGCYGNPADSPIQIADGIGRVTGSTQLEAEGHR